VAAEVAPAIGASLAPGPKTKPLSVRLAIIIFFGVTVGLVTYLFRPPPPPLQVTAVTRLSQSGHAFRLEHMLTDGVRLYYHEFTGTSFRLRQVLLPDMGDTLVPGLPPDFLFRGLSPDHTTFLTMPRPVDHLPLPFWLVPVVGGQPRRMGNFLANEAAWSPDGSLLVYARGPDLFVVGSDGTGERFLARLPGWVGDLRWSPDGRRLRLTVSDTKGQLALWELAADGSRLHPLRFPWPGSPLECCGEWTADGRYFVFESRREGTSNIWALEEKSNCLRCGDPKPIQLTFGPMNYYRPLPSHDGKQIFAIGTQPLGKLQRYDLTRKKFVRFLEGLSADQLDFTRDGQWVTYVSFPEGTLWRARSDGSQALRLTSLPLRVGSPRWSPDGKRIAFAALRPGEVWKVYTISLDGGNPEPIVFESDSQPDVTWFPAGDSLVYGRHFIAEKKPAIALYRANPLTGRTERIAGTDGLYSPRVSPDGHYLAALEVVSHGLFVIDVKTGKRTQLSHRQADYPAWSADSRYLYFNTIVTTDPAVFRVRVPDGKEERITKVDFAPPGVYGVWTGLAPDGSLLVLRNRDRTEVYALTLNRP